MLAPSPRVDLNSTGGPEPVDLSPIPWVDFVSVSWTLSLSSLFRCKGSIVYDGINGPNGTNVSDETSGFIEIIVNCDHRARRLRKDCVLSSLRPLGASR